MPRLSREVVEKREAMVVEYFKSHGEGEEEKAIEAVNAMLKAQTGMAMNPARVRELFRQTRQQPEATPASPTPKVEELENKRDIFEEVKEGFDELRESREEGKPLKVNVVETTTKYESASEEITVLKARIKALENEVLTYRAAVGTLKANATKIYTPGIVTIIDVPDGMPTERAEAVMEIIKETAKENK